MILKVEKMHVDALLPEYAHDLDAGMDIFSLNEYVLYPGDRCLIRTGIRIELPIEAEAQIRPKSGLALKYGITILNSPGTIDAGYRGEIMVIIINHGREIFTIKKHMKIAQMIVKPILKVSIEEAAVALDTTSRGANGFGSTGL